MVVMEITMESWGWLYVTILMIVVTDYLTILSKSAV